MVDEQIIRFFLLPRRVLQVRGFDAKVNDALVDLKSYDFCKNPVRSFKNSTNLLYEHVER